jgi:ribosomal protein S18 acetylase RimI-like enzyme
LNEQSHGTRSVIVAKENDKFCGYVTIKWKSEYPAFSQKNIPEISDLNVLPYFRKNGIGTMLIHACEALAKEHGHASIGLGVGMTADYGNAQRLYVHLGYVPDGYGLHYKNSPLNYGDKTIVDDDLVIYLSKLNKNE